VDPEGLLARLHQAVLAAGDPLDLGVGAQQVDPGLEVAALLLEHGVALAGGTDLLALVVPGAGRVAEGEEDAGHHEGGDEDAPDAAVAEPRQPGRGRHVVMASGLHGP
jgi:hypothetical protein